VTTQLGLRERKKQQTRDLIAKTAARLFAERGFDAVTVAEVARDANVSEVTVFNYFPAEEAEYGTVSGADYLHRMKNSFIRCRARPASSRSATPRIPNGRLADSTSITALNGGFGPPRYVAARSRPSLNDTPAARTLTRTSPGPGWGMSSSTTFKTSGPPK
jgi:hypothetical protein